MHHTVTAKPDNSLHPPAAQPHSHMILNLVMKQLLRSPLHWLVSKHFMLITFTGRKSGKQFTTPVTYVRNGDTIHFFSNQKWWKNLQGSAPVSLRVQGKKFAGIATPTQDRTTIVREISAFLTRMGPQKAFMINLALPPNRAITETAINAAAHDHVVIYIKLDQVK